LQEIVESSGCEWRESLANEDAIGASIGVEPAGKVEGSLDEEELTVGVRKVKEMWKRRNTTNHSSLRLSPKKTVSSGKMAAINTVMLGAFYKFLSFYVYLSIFLRGITGRTPLKKSHGSHVTPLPSGFNNWILLIGSFASLIPFFENA
jgi:hypothetical protein